MKDGACCQLFFLQPLSLGRTHPVQADAITH
jgi:hypothetical protein